MTGDTRRLVERWRQEVETWEASARYLELHHPTNHGNADAALRAKAGRAALEALSTPSPTRVTRIEVINETGRVYSRHDVSVSLRYQDDGRTLKVFVPALAPYPECQWVRGVVGDKLYCYGGCGRLYQDFPCDVILPTPLWNRIAVGPPFDETQTNIEREGRGGVLCPACIMERLANLPGTTVICADIERPVPAPREAAHYCAGCGHRWEGDRSPVELCGDCWRKHTAVAPREAVRVLEAIRNNRKLYFAVGEFPDICQALERAIGQSPPMLKGHAQDEGGM